METFENLSLRRGGRNWRFDCIFNDLEFALVHPTETLFVHCFLIELELECSFLRREENSRIWRKTPRGKAWSHVMIPPNDASSRLRTRARKASARTTAPSLLSHTDNCCYDMTSLQVLHVKALWVNASIKSLLLFWLLLCLSFHWSFLLLTDSDRAHEPINSRIFNPSAPPGRTLDKLCNILSCWSVYAQTFGRSILPFVINWCCYVGITQTFYHELWWACY